jgi:hypothetical protein
MKITDLNVSFVLFFIPFLFTQCLAEWGAHGQRMRPPEYSDGVQDSLATRNVETDPINNSSTYSDSMSQPVTNPAIGKCSTGTAVSVLRDSVSSCGITSKKDFSNSGTSVYNASIVDYCGRVQDSVLPIVGIKKFRGTVVPGGDTIHFKVPVFGNISLENIEFSGLVYKEPELIVETEDFENPYSFASGFWTILSSAGGLVTLGLATEPLIDMSYIKTQTTMLLVCGYLIAGAGQYFGVDKLVKHFRWNHQFGNRVSLHN